MKKIYALILFSFIGIIAHAQLAWFGAPTNFAINSGPTYIICDDFNGDGFKDLVTADYNSNNISILLGVGTGSFSPANNFPVGTNPQAVITADFNGDGKLDLVTANNNSSNLSVLLGTGTGSFGATTNFGVGSQPLSVCSADFNGDGKLDLASANNNSSNLSVLLGTGTGSFNVATNHATGLGPVAIISSDFNNDGKADLAVVNGSAGNVSIYLGTGTGNFGAATNFIVSGQPWSVTCADFNGDSNIDLVMGSQGNVISVLLGTGTGAFGTVTNFPVGNWPYYNSWPYSIICKDFNGDGKVDLATANFDNGASILLGTGTGSFGASTNFATGSRSYSVISEDFNGDAKLDLAVANLLSSDVSILLSVPTPTCIASVADSLYNISPLNWGLVVHYSPQVTSALWSWGDGTYSNALYPSHTYSAAGGYNICVTAYTSCGDSANYCTLDSIYRMTGNNAMVNISVVPNSNSINQFTNSNSQIKVYPNPFTENITLNFVSEENNKITYEIFDMMGNQIVKENVNVKKGENEFKISAHAIAKGVYFINVSDGKKSNTLKVVK